MAAILEQLNERDRALFEFISYTGVRTSEALGGKRGDVMDSPTGPVFVVHKAKTDAGVRSVALIPHLARSLTKQCTATTLTSGVLYQLSYVGGVGGM